MLGGNTPELPYLLAIVGGKEVPQDKALTEHLFVVNSLSPTLPALHKIRNEHHRIA
jgi:hypothetical protein